MGSLQDGLRMAGCVDEKHFSETSAQKILDAEVEAAKTIRIEKEITKRLGILQGCTSPPEFRSESRKLLLMRPSLIQEILNIAHSRGMHQAPRKSKGGGWIIANLYQVKEAIERPRLSEEAKIDIIDKQFLKK